MTADAQAVHAAIVDEVLRGRHSVRGYLPRAVPRPLLREILEVAARAPSGTNMQPWRVHVLTGASRQSLVAATCAAFDAGDRSHRAEYAYYPETFFDPYLGRRRQLGFALYGLLGIARGDTARMQAQHRRNFEFFDAPVGLMFSIDRRLALGSWLDYGMFLQNIMVAARARGLDTCPQAAWIDFHRIVSEVCSFDDNEQLVCGMALGYADPNASENSLASTRVAVDDFTVFHADD